MAVPITFFRARRRSLRTVLLFFTLVVSVVSAPPPLREDGSSADDNIQPASDADPYRLPRSVLPTQYTLRLKPDLEKATFEGEVVIEVEAKEETDRITLNAEGIVFDDVSVTRQDAESTSDDNLFKEYADKTAYEIVDIILNTNLDANENYTIKINYTGTLRDNMYGFYISSYVSDGENHTLAATQFQATHARKAFPCFDEPSFKARFKVSVFAPAGYKALGNMPVDTSSDESEETEDTTGTQDTTTEHTTTEDTTTEHTTTEHTTTEDTTVTEDTTGTEVTTGTEDREYAKWYTFQNSMKMSSYLVAFVVSKFEEKEDPHEGEVVFKTWARTNALDGTQYSLDVSRQMLYVLENYTGINYIDETLEFPLNKVDQVALPDFSAGAMENWGLITYRETNLLYNGGPAAAQKRVATTIAHELLHMWFGNLITTYWWDTTWLNEGFARYFQYYVTDKVETEWRMWDQFLVDQLHSVFALDALVTAKALTHGVSSPADASASFGTITYNKGGSILRMISYTIGPENFQTALQEYLNAHKYSTVEPQDLFDQLKKFASIASRTEEQFQELLLSWTEQPGYPVVNVLRYYDPNDATVSQARFLFKNSSDEQYIVPITWTYEGGSSEPQLPTQYLIPHANMDITGMPASDKWVIFNTQQTGYYRVNYDAQNWALLSSHLNNLDKSIDDIHLLNRAQLLDDAFNLARASQLSYKTAFDLADYLTRETDYVPWAAALTAFSYLDRMLVNHAKYAVFQRYVLRLIEKSYGSFSRFFYVNNSPDNHDEKLLFNRLATWACSMGHTMCIERTANAIRRHLYGDQLTNQDQRSVVFCSGIRNTANSQWTGLWQMYKDSFDDTDRGLMVAGLGCSSDEDRLKELLEHTISGEYIRKQDASSVFSAVYTNPDGLEVALQFLNDNFEEILNYYGSMGSINSIVTGIAGRLTTEEQKIKFEAFVETHSERLGATGASALETVDDNLEWIQSHVSEIFTILENKELEQYRLPQWVTPTHYTLSITPNLNLPTFTGEVTIHVTAEEATDVIIMHSENVTLTQGSVKRVGDDEELFYGDTYDQLHEFVKIYLTRALVPGSDYILTLTFFGFMRDNMYGLYISKYINEENNEITLAATQFQATHARKAFPCFDEPSFKATFTVTIIIPPDYHAIGNMPIATTIVRDDLSSEVTFLTTPPMSTYLLAFVVSDFESLQDPNAADVEFRTWARRNALSWGNYSIQVSSDILRNLEVYTDINYIDSELENPFTKVDQVAIPDFSAGAMENWGLVTYRETMLLYNDGTASARKSIATVIAHELAHMWFGNLVTTRWWDTTWLNEGFAQYFMFFITDKIHPDWRLMDQFVFDHHQGIMTSDALASAAALSSPAYTPSQVSGRFSSITYSKGAAILRMLSSILGENDFQDVLQIYLWKHRYSNTIPDDLFEEFSKKTLSANLDARYIIGLLRSWTEQPGFPVLEVERFYSYGTVLVSQKRFLLKTPTIADTRRYFVPLTWVVEGGNFSNTRPQRYLTDVQVEGTIESVPDPNKWVILNVQSTGFYRVNYDATNWWLISVYLRNHTKPLDDIHLLNRAQLLDDAFNLARAGQLQYETVFYLTDYLRRETDYVPWSSALSGFAYLQRMLIFDSEYSLFKEYVLHLIEVQYNRFQFRDRERHIEKLLLNRVSLWACSLEHQHCTTAARDALHGFLDNKIIVPADLRSVVYCYGVRHSDATYWHKMLDEYQNSLDNAERALLMAGLACSHDEERLEELLNHSISDTFIRRQDASGVFTSVYGNTVGVEVALNFLDQNFDAVEEYYGSMGAINNIVVGIAGRLTTQIQRQTLESFLQKHSTIQDSVAAAALETVDENLEWLATHRVTILEFLNRNLVTFPDEYVESTTTAKPTTPETTPLETTVTTTTDISTTEGAGSIRATALAVLLLLATVLLL